MATFLYPLLNDTGAYRRAFGSAADWLDIAPYVMDNYYAR